MSDFYCRFQVITFTLVRHLFLMNTAVFVLISSHLSADNQTPTTTPILSQDSLPFTISIEEDSFSLPTGLHSGATANYKGMWVFIAGRTNGLHDFSGIDPFPPCKQNTVAYVVDFQNKTTYSRALNDVTSGLTQTQIDELSVTSPQSFQKGKTLYICGGYGVDTSTGEFGTKKTLTALDLPKFIKWVKNGEGSAAGAIRQTSSPWMQVTGGIMAITNNHLQGLLFFGQNFTGVYTDSSNGNYTKQARRFQIYDNGKKIVVRARNSEEPNPDYRRRDLNVVPIIKKGKPAYVALSGVFTESVGIWTVPILINPDGSTKMANPDSSDTFKQGMNNYVSATSELYSRSTKDNYILQLGGISFGYYDNSVFTTDSEFPFINQVTTIKIDKACEFSQYIMDAEYPVILSQGTNPGNRLIFGAGAYYFNSNNVKELVNQIIDIDQIKTPTVIGYVVGGIMSTVPNTSTINDSTASPYIFKVILNPS